MNQVADTITKLKSSELPASCPPRSFKGANEHPRVYLKFNDTGHAKCPYCGAKFAVED